MDRSVFGPPQWRTAAVMYRRTADVIPIVALKNPFAERDRIRRRRFRYTARYDSHLFGCLMRRGGERASRVEWISSRDLGGMRETNRIKTAAATRRGPPPLPLFLHLLTHSVTHVTRVACEAATPKESHQRASYCAHTRSIFYKGHRDLKTRLVP